MHSPIAICTLLVFPFIAVSSASCSPKLPIVDLGYAVHQATVNETGRWFNFSNIHYAQAPRFAAPTAITTVNRTINDGQTPGVCSVAVPFWNKLLPGYLTGSLTVDQLNTSYLQVQALDPVSNPSGAEQYVTEPDLIATEDCLTLDVIVPEVIWDKAQKNATVGAPVMVWIVGGGYCLGDKTQAGNPAGLIAAAKEDGSDGVIYVTLNYRLGLFGWMSGPDFQAQGGVSNIGLRDQQSALKWVHENIHLFGGDPNLITVFGESAGGGSIMHLLTAFGSSEPGLFRRAIPQSPGFQVLPQISTQNQRFSTALEWASYFSGSNVTNLDQMKRLPFDVLWKVNQITVGTAYWGSFNWGPAVDGDIVPDLPGVLLLEGRFDQSVDVLAAHNSNEGYLFASPLITTQEEYAESLKLLLPETSDETIDFLDTVLYPPVYNGTYPWTSALTRSTVTVSDSWFACNSRAINRALQDKARGYYFDLGQGWHGDDLPYTYWNGEESLNGLPIAVAKAKQFQAYLTTFAKTGNPNVEGLPMIPIYGANSTVLQMSQGTSMRDDAANERCDWWQQASYR